MALIQNLISKDRYSIKCPFTMVPEGICIHNTANDATAKNEVAYMGRNDNKVSFHIAVDDVEAIQCIPFDRNAYAAGDGSGPGNRKHIHIEICYSKSGGAKFASAEKRSAMEVADILKKFGWGISKVKKHQDFSGKYCPHRTLDMGWERFLGMVKGYLNESASSVPGRKYRVVADSCKEVANAKNTQNMLKLHSIDTFIDVFEKDNTKFHRVIAGSYSDKPNAEKQVLKLNNLGFKSFIAIYETDKPKELHVGSKVKISLETKRYATGELIPDFVKAKEYSIKSIKNDMALLDNIVSWVYKKDLIIV